MDRYISKFKNNTGSTVYFISKTSCCGNSVEWEHGSSMEACPCCGNKYYKKPNLENKLFCLQDEFLDDYSKTGSTEILGKKMFPLICEYAVNLIKAMVKGKKSLSERELEMRAWDAATLLIEVIMRDPDHRMRYSFGKYLGDLCKSVCYSTKNHEHTYSLNSILKNGETELGETIVASLNDVTGGYEVSGEIRVNNVVEIADYREDIAEKITNLVVKSANVLHNVTESYENKLLYLQGLLLKFKDDRLLAGFFEEAGKCVKNYVEKGELLVFNELYALAK